MYSSQEYTTSQEYKNDSLWAAANFEEGDYFFIIKIFTILEKKMVISLLFDQLSIQKGKYNIFKVIQIMNINTTFINEVFTTNIYHCIK